MKIWRKSCGQRDGQVQKPEGGRSKYRAGEVGKGQIMQNLMGFPTEVIFA